jgi:hypothetical protein
MCLFAWLESYPSRRTLSLLCFSLALGKIEVILFSCKCAGAPLLRASTTEEWKPVQAAPFLRTHTLSSHIPSQARCPVRPGNEPVRFGLPRKEVIQPHLPVRLPCYDFTPITNPTLDACLPKGVSPAASGVADFRGVTGGVYKTRERIHRDVLTHGY